MPADSPLAVGAGIRVFHGYRVVSVHGASRVAVVVLRNHQESLRVLADALILAARMRPMRNIEGAIEQRDGAFFCQPQEGAIGTQGAEIAASETANLVQAMLGSGQLGLRIVETR
jgi:hypothetical protein